MLLKKSIITLNKRNVMLKELSLTIYHFECALGCFVNSGHKHIQYIHNVSETYQIWSQSRPNVFHSYIFTSLLQPVQHFHMDRAVNVTLKILFMTGWQIQIVDQGRIYANRF